MTAQQRLRQRGLFEALGRGGGVAVAGGVGSIAATSGAGLIVGAAAQVLRTTTAARTTAVHWRHAFPR